MADPRIKVDGLANGIAWISATEVPPDSWIELAANRRAPVRLDMREIAEVPAEFPLRLLLQPAMLEGFVYAGLKGARSGVAVWRIYGWSLRI